MSGTDSGKSTHIARQGHFPQPFRYRDASSSNDPDQFLAIHTASSIDFVKHGFQSFLMLLSHAGERPGSPVELGDPDLCEDRYRHYRSDNNNANDSFHCCLLNDQVSTGCHGVAGCACRACTICWPASRPNTSPRSTEVEPL
jgi:hypothetical protein